MNTGLFQFSGKETFFSYFFVAEQFQLLTQVLSYHSIINFLTQWIIVWLGSNFDYLKNLMKYPQTIEF